MQMFTILQASRTPGRYTSMSMGLSIPAHSEQSSVEFLNMIMWQYTICHLNSLLVWPGCHLTTFVLYPTGILKISIQIFFNYRSCVVINSL